MKLRKLARLCEHDSLHAHYVATSKEPQPVCPGGVFLPDDTLIIEKVQCGRCVATPGTVDVVAGFADCPTCHGSGKVWPEWFVNAAIDEGVRMYLDALAVKE